MHSNSTRKVACVADSTDINPEAVPELLQVCKRLAAFNIHTTLLETGVLDDLHAAIAKEEREGRVSTQ